MAVYAVTLTKTIVTLVEAICEGEAEELALKEDADGDLMMRWVEAEAEAEADEHDD